MSRNCPDCEKPLAPQTLHGVELDICGGCAGIWFDASELRMLITRDSLALASLEERYAPSVEPTVHGDSKRRCPDCEELLQQYNYQYSSTILLDTCPDCAGFWVQEGELVAMQHWIDADRKPAAPDEKDKLAVAQFTFEHHQKTQRFDNVRGMLAVLHYRRLR